MAIGNDTATGLDRAARRREQNRNAQKNLRQRKRLAKQSEEYAPKQQQSEQSNQEQVHDWSSSLTANDAPWSSFSNVNNVHVTGTDDNLFDLDDWTHPTHPSPAPSDCNLAMPEVMMQVEHQPVDPAVQKSMIEFGYRSPPGQQRGWRAETASLQRIENTGRRSSTTASGQARSSVHTRTARHSSQAIFTQQPTPPESSNGHPSPPQLQQRGPTCLHLAAKNSSISLVRYFITRGMDPDICDADGMTALHYAVHEGHEDIVDLLIASGADVDATDDHGKTALHHAVEQRQEGMAVLLIHKGADMQAAVEVA